MKFCQPHWDELKAAVIAHGVGDLISSDGAEAVSRMTDELKGKAPTLERYDPLLTAHGMITNRAMECGGLYLLMTQTPDGRNDGHWCPLCEVDAHSHPGVASEWIRGASKSAADHARSLPRCSAKPPA